jgi:catechol 2,3-dioxygenase-like lactoylglutathione lyase family enzyme
MPNLENLKKQAKLYVHWHRDHYYPVAAQIRAVLPRFKDLTDRQVLEAEFKLSDAQELVARQSGFESWQALKTGVQAMPDTIKPERTAPILIEVAAELYVADIKTSCDYFTSKLGFTVVFTYGEPPFYGQVKRDNARINLRMVCEPVFVGDIREREQLLAASMTVDSAAEIRELFVQYQAVGVDFLQTLKQEPWGARTFIVRDPDGNLLLFAGPATYSGTRLRPSTSARLSAMSGSRASPMTRKRAGSSSSRRPSRKGSSRRPSTSRRTRRPMARRASNRPTCSIQRRPTCWISPTSTRCRT